MILQELQCYKLASKDETSISSSIRSNSSRVDSDGLVMLKEYRLIESQTLRYCGLDGADAEAGLPDAAFVCHRKISNNYIYKIFTFKRCDLTRSKGRPLLHWIGLSNIDEDMTRIGLITKQKTKKLYPTISFIWFPTFLIPTTIFFFCHLLLLHLLLLSIFSSPPYSFQRSSSLSASFF